MGWLCALVIAVAIVALVGHLMWVLAATILREVFASQTAGERVPTARSFSRCPTCRAPADPRELECALCGFQFDTRPHQLARVRAAEAEVRELAGAGDLDSEIAETVIAQLERRARLLQGLPADGASPAAVPIPESPTFQINAPVSVSESRAEPTLSSNVPPSEEDTDAPAVDLPVSSASFETAAVGLPQRRGSVLAAFMEERNILWGELVGGLLIVGCSIALVVTLWNRIETIPYFPFILSAIVTGALYGAGHYTLHHWKLESTSRGLLVIALLLAPLNLLLLADPISRAEVPLPFDIAFKISAIALLGWVVRGGGRDVLFARPDWRWLLALAVVGAPAVQLLPAAWFAEAAPHAPAWLALGCFAGAIALALRSTSRHNEELFERQTGATLLQFVGLAAFGLAAAWGLHVARSPDTAGQLRGLAFPLTLAAVPVVEAGLLVQRRVLGGALRATGTGVALSGFSLMTAGLAVAWPDPLSILLVSLAAGLFLTRIAFRDSLPWAHAGAIPALALAITMAYHGIAGHWTQPLVRAIGSSETGIVLAVLAIILAAAAEVLVRRGSRQHAVSYAIGGAGVGLVGLFLATVNGPEHPVQAAAAHAVCALGLLAANARWRLRALAHGGLWLILIASLWALEAAYPRDFARWGFAVALESFAFAGLALVLKRVRGPATALLRRAGRDVSIAAVAVAALGPVLAIIHGTIPDSAWNSGTLFTLALTGLALARLTGAPLATYLGSGAAFLGVIHLAAFHLTADPAARPFVVGMLALATTMTILAAFFLRQERVFAYPLRRAAQVIAGVTMLVLFVPPAANALEWAGYAAWLGLVWLAIALVWREREAFAVFQVALSLAAVLIGAAWVDAQDWRPATSLGFFAPAALHAYGVALGLLGVGWVAVRRGVRGSEIARALWTVQTWSAERVVLAVVVVGHLVLAALAILPEVRAELRPVDWPPFRAEPVELLQAFGPGAWVLLGVLAVVLTASWRFTGGERDTDAHLLGVVLLFLTMPVLWAGSHAGDVAAGTALRWGLGLAFVIGTALLAARQALRAGLLRAGFPVHPSPFARPVVLALLAVAAGVVVLIFAQVTELGLSGRRPSGPLAGSPFAAMGAVASNLVPLALVVLGLAGTAVRERSAGYAFAGGLVFTGTLAAAYALGVISAGGRLDGIRQVHIVLLACGGPAVWSLAWLAAERRVPGGPLLAVQSRLGLFGLALSALFFAIPIFTRPAWGLMPAAGEFGQLGWIALAVAAGAAVWRAVRSERRVTFHTLAFTATIAAVLAACAVQPWDEPGRWLSFHVLAMAATAVGVGLAAAVRTHGEALAWLDGFAVMLALMALRGVHDPWRPWLPAGLAVVASGLVGATAIRSRDQSRVIISGLLLNLAAILVWLSSDTRTVSGLMLAIAAGLAVASGVWTAFALRLDERRWRDSLDLGRGIALVLLAFGLAPTLAGDPVDPHWITWSSTLLVMVSCAAALWDRDSRIARGGLFAAGVAVVLLGVAATTTLPVWDVWQAPVALAACVALTAALAVRVISATTPILHIPERGGTWGWLLIAQGVVALVAIGVGLRIELTAPDEWERLAGPGAVALLFLAAFALRDALTRWRETLDVVVTALMACLVVTLAWSIPDPADPHVWLHRNARAFVFLTLIGTLTMLVIPGLTRRLNFPRRNVGVFAALAFIVLCVNLVQQVPVYDRVTRHTPLQAFDILGMLLGIIILIVLSIRFALRQELDPLGMRDGRRTAYVYLAEVLLVLLFTHIRFNIPELFLGAAVRYWTFAVMGLAFVGIGLAELFERRRVNVLAIPLRRTGVLLPLIPLLAFWAKPPEFLNEFAAGRAPGLSPFLTYLEKLPQHFDTYAWLWFLAGGVYGLVALSRKSFGWALLAALATNAALWSLLTHHEVPFIVHPQAWVIPLALIVLGSEHVNRRRLREDVSNGMRYLGVAMIYVASAADMFIAGVGQSVWLPVVLAVLCVAGVLVGIMMRVRAFLFLGVGFLFLDIFAMIWHAAVNLEQTWVWYASGIVLGVAILALFAVFEKRKKKQVEA